MCSLRFSIRPFTTGPAPATRSSSAPPRWWCAGWSPVMSGHTRSLEPLCGTDRAACPAGAPRSANTSAAAPPTGRDGAASTCKKGHQCSWHVLSSVSICIKTEEYLPQFTCTACRLTDEDDDREDLGSVQTTYTVQPQWQYTVNALQGEEMKVKPTNSAVLMTTSRCQQDSTNPLRLTVTGHETQTLTTCGIISCYSLCK